MNSEGIHRAHWSFWLITVIALLWNIGGAANYLMQTNLEFVAMLPETHRAIIEGRPRWTTGGFVIGVFGGALGCLLLLLKKANALYIFIASLLGIIITMIHTVNVSTSKVEFSLADIFLMILSPMIVAGFLIWYTRIVINKRWVN